MVSRKEVIHRYEFYNKAFEKVQASLLFDFNL